MVAAQRYIAQMKAEQARASGALARMGTLEGAGAEILAQGRSLMEAIEEPRQRHQAARVLMERLAADPEMGQAASLTLAMLGDASQVPSAEHYSLLERTKRDSRPEGYLDKAIGVALSELDQVENRPGALMQFGGRMLNALPYDDTRPMEKAYAGVRMVANLTARFDPEGKMLGGEKARDFLTANLRNLIDDAQSPAVARVTVQCADEGLSALGEMMSFAHSLHGAGSTGIGQTAGGVRVGGVFLRSRR